ncbi:hypothetical protein CBR_g340 [Chara braunii]|uniref:J domain-containing protein n=1 Tax=Chara braunii TaxID=69332 RepID=A0A388JQE5_CHABU|nr:hypothetical protein CBR_g340 [Chara braunii]|eukprot:GBG60010.1 hypothetical protein CBR_g340 [Chara braunii]
MTRRAAEEAEKLRQRANEMLRQDPRNALRYAEEANVKNYTPDGDKLITIIRIHIAAAVRMPGSPDGRDWYGILQVNPTDSHDTMRTKYRALCLHTHPDKAKNFDGCENAFRLLKLAWEVLGDANKRRAYDQSLAQRRAPGGLAGGGGGARGGGGGGGGVGGVNYGHYSSSSTVPPSRSGSGSTPSSSSSATVSRPAIQEPFTVAVTCPFCKHACRRKYSVMMGRQVLSDELIFCAKCQRNFYP